MRKVYNLSHVLAFFYMSYSAVVEKLPQMDLSHTKSPQMSFNDLILSKITQIYPKLSKIMLPQNGIVGQLLVVLGHFDPFWAS